MRHMEWVLVLAVTGLVGCAGAEKKTDNATTTAPTAAPSQVVNSGTESELAKISCTKDDETRTLQIKPVGEGCGLDYTKQGKNNYYLDFEPWSGSLPTFAEEDPRASQKGRL